MKPTDIYEATEHLSDKIESGDLLSIDVVPVMARLLMNDQELFEDEVFDSLCDEKGEILKELFFSVAEAINQIHRMRDFPNAIRENDLVVGAIPLQTIGRIVVGGWMQACQDHAEKHKDAMYNDVIDAHQREGDVRKYEGAA